MGRLKRLLIVLLLVAATIGSDRATKGLAKHALKSRPPISFFGGLVRLQYAENPGAFLSAGAELSETARFWLFVVLSGGFLTGLFFYILWLRVLTLRELIAFSLILGGGIGNLIDRLVDSHRVIDFLVIGIGWLRTGIFNLADVAITAGVGLLFWLSFRATRRSELQTGVRHD